MNYLTLIGGPAATPRTGNAPPLTAQTITTGGATYHRHPSSTPGDAVYVWADHKPAKPRKVSGWRRFWWGVGMGITPRTVAVLVPPPGNTSQEGQNTA